MGEDITVNVEKCEWNMHFMNSHGLFTSPDAGRRRPAFQRQRAKYGPMQPACMQAALRRSAAPAFHSSTTIEEMRNSSSRKVRLAHADNFVKGGLNFRWSCPH